MARRHETTAGATISTATNVTVCAGLLALTLATALLGQVDLGPWNLVLALVIAGAKAALIVLYFMHIRVSPSFMGLAVLGAVLWLGLLLVGGMDDYVTRAWLASATH